MNMSTVADTPKPFTRVITTPPGFPWDQMRVAELEARHTSPLSGAITGDELHIILRRLGAWRPRQAGRFVAVYFRGSHRPEGQAFQIEIEGQTLQIGLASRGRQAEVLKQALIQYGAVLVIVISFAFALGLTWQRRQDADMRMSAIETDLDRLDRQAASVERAKADARALGDMALKGRTVGDALKALRTVSIGQNPEARIDVFVWHQGQWGLEVHGAAPPLSIEDLNMRRAERPLRPGVWLWIAEPDVPPPALVTAKGAPDGL